MENNETKKPFDNGIVISEWGMFNSAFKDVCTTTIECGRTKIVIVDEDYFKGHIKVEIKEEAPEVWDLCYFWDDDILIGNAEVYMEYRGGYHRSIDGQPWQNCKVIKKANGTATSNP